MSFAGSEFSNQDLPLDDWVETADLEVPFLQRRNLAWQLHGNKVQVLGLEVGKVDTSNFFSWLRVKLAKCEHRRWDFLRRQIFFELDWGENYPKIAELFRFVNCCNLSRIPSRLLFWVCQGGG